MNKNSIFLITSQVHLLSSIKKKKMSSVYFLPLTLGQSLTTLPPGICCIKHVPAVLRTLASGLHHGMATEQL